MVAFHSYVSLPEGNRMEHHQFCLQTDDHPTQTYMNLVGKKGPQIGKRFLLNRSLWGFCWIWSETREMRPPPSIAVHFSGKHISFLEMQSIVFHDWLNQAVLPNLAVDRSLWSDPTSCMHTYIYLLIWFFFVYLHNLYDPIWWTMYVTGSPKTIRFGWSKFSINAAAMDFRLGSHPSMYPSHPMASAYLRTELSRSSGINFQRILKLREEQNCPVPSGLSVTWKSAYLAVWVGGLEVWEFMILWTYRIKFYQNLKK